MLLVGSEAPADDVGGISPPGSVMLTVARRLRVVSLPALLSLSLSLVVLNGSDPRRVSKVFCFGEYLFLLADYGLILMFGLTCTVLVGVQLSE